MAGKALSLQDQFLNTVRRSKTPVTASEPSFEQDTSSAPSPAFAASACTCGFGTAPASLNPAFA